MTSRQSTIQETREALYSARSRVMQKSHLFIEILDKPTVFVEIGTEWDNPDFFDQPDLFLRDVSAGYRDNDETTCIMVDALSEGTCGIHFHDNTESILCVKGRVEIWTPDKVYVLDPRDNNFLKIPAYVKHKVTFLENAMLFISWHPKFPDKKD
jgi:quercetin dioxygenase-like cupin family protein